jgi:hypothetical protein
MRSLLLLALMFSTQAAAMTAAEAEEIRLTEEMRSLARRNVWSGVDRMYRALSDLGAQLSAPQHVLGAHAAQDLGDIQACYDRLRAAARLDPTREVIDWLWAIDSTYGQVELTAEPGVSLSVTEPPIDAVQRKVIGLAAEHLATSGQFVGMLPVGEYAMGGMTLVVTSGHRTALAQ